MPFGFHPLYLVILLVIVLIIFGPGKLPQLGGAIGKSMREFRNHSEGLQDEIRNAFEERGQEKGENTSQASASDTTSAGAADSKPAASAPAGDETTSKQ
ncbi:MAG: twin-arginine translocase TatA/TatE family subunit [Candidatus Dormibacteraeota bacterium]|nr:twin-arginine translocase TatA/TatE family subunit [Candidatus Dormibacteraeota bacterium]MBO0760148.1 twin-arginine translocase TatA/TatE family subunit [Candidatus Dormibacteraeota bacterium]